MAYEDVDMPAEVVGSSGCQVKWHMTLLLYLQICGYIIPEWAYYSKMLTTGTDRWRYKLRNIEETEAAKKVLQEKRLVGRTKTELSIPASYSADYFQRGKDYAEKLRREHPELYKDKNASENGAAARPAEASNNDAAGRRQAATDELMLDRFRKRERHRVMRR
ncbi:hypothetical protein IFM89_020162 [Coptis chinensis]|uniref:Uncharacterized protein n=1 Tax=Coptis chinensis TaxID=261450 RepID=A0A835H9V6_9MAGN|nr:hypothetical protein IFM89_020162 [Coptis chinensis]